MFQKATTCIAFLIFVLSSANALVWPTANPAFLRGESIEAYVQATASGNPISGVFGCVRNGGKRFHEGLDLFGLRRDANFEVLDVVFSVLPGEVVYMNEDPSRSRYGRYAVISHREKGVSFYSLYAHLHSFDASVQLGVSLKEGQPIGRMGRSAGGYTIPKERAHLHFELGVKLSDQFQKWYDAEGFETKNWHADWNGMNLIGVDPLDFYEAIRSQRVHSFGDYLSQLKPRLKLRVRFDGTPSFLKANKKFSKIHTLKESEIAGWEVVLSQYGIPNSWKPLRAGSLKLPEGQDFQLIAYNKKVVDADCCSLFKMEAGRVSITQLTLSNLKKLFVQ